MFLNANDELPNIMSQSVLTMQRAQFGGGHPRGKRAADQPAHARACGRVDRNVVLLEPLDHADMRDSRGRFRRRTRSPPSAAPAGPTPPARRRRRGDRRPTPPRRRARRCLSNEIPLAMSRPCSCHSRVPPANMICRGPDPIAAMAADLDSLRTADSSRRAFGSLRGPAPGARSPQFSHEAD